MKKLNKIILLFILLLGLCILPGCKIKELFCDHQYEVVEIKEPTCTEHGFKKEVCSKCGHEKTTVLKAKGHTKKDKIKVVLPTCSEDGYTLYTCSVCGEQFKDEIVKALGHEYGEWQIEIPATENEDGLLSRVCNRCNQKETKTYQFNDYIDFSVIEFTPDFEKTYKVNSIEPLQIIFDSAVLNYAPSFTVNINFDFDLQTLLNTLANNCSLPLNANVGCKSLGKKITFTFNYNAKGPTVKASEVDNYSQYESLNYEKTTSPRPSDFNSFPINKSTKTYKVTTTDQLVYVLERGYLPIMEVESKTSKIYEIAKATLRNIISNDMSDLEKVRAIHDWIILNVTYDDALLKLSTTPNVNLPIYNGFYLEGVFIDHRAVCEGISKAFSLMCAIEGIPCVQVSGYNKENPRGVGHAWNKVYLNNNWYVIDVTSDGPIISNTFEILSYEYFLISDKTMSERYIGKDYNNIKCNNDFNMYEHLTFNHKNKTNDLVITNKKELRELVSYANSLYNNYENFSIQFLITFDYGSSISDELSEAYLLLGINPKFSAVYDYDIITLIK